MKATVDTRRTDPRSEALNLLDDAHDRANERRDGVRPREHLLAEAQVQATLYLGDMIGVLMGEVRR